MAKKKAAKVDKKASYDLAMERLNDAVESLDEAQALLADEAGTSEFLVGIIFSSQTLLALVAEMASEFEKEAAKAAKKPARKRR
jgi:hypothetical protein